MFKSQALKRHTQILVTYLCQNLVLITCYKCVYTRSAVYMNPGFCVFNSSPNHQNKQDFCQSMLAFKKIL